MIVKVLTEADLPLLYLIDRTEVVKALYRQYGTKLMRERTEIHVEQWSSEKCHAHIAWQFYELQKGGVYFGAFEGEVLLGVAVLGNRPVGGDPKTVQLVFLHVSAPHRRKGVGGALLAEVRKTARMRGMKRLYISATPTESAVNFYTSKGAKPLEKPDPGLFSKEPEDIHMVLEP